MVQRSEREKMDAGIGEGEREVEGEK